MTDLFTFDTSFTKEETTKAIFDVEVKNWGKRQSAAAKEQREFSEPKPELETVKSRLDKGADGRTLTAGEALISYATDGELTLITDEGLPLTEAQAKKFGAAFIQVEKNNEAADRLHPEVITIGSDGKEYQVEPKELSAWLQDNARAGKNVPVDQWAMENKIGLTAHGDIVQNGDETLYIETRLGERRTFGNGNKSEKLDGYYGAIKDESLRVGDGDYLDVYISKQIYNDMKITGGSEGNSRAEAPYNGKIFVMQEMEDGKPGELKLGFAKDVDEFRQIMTSTFTKKEDFRNFEGKYIELTQDQYQQLKAEIAKDPKLTVDDFIKRTGIEGAERIPEALKKDEKEPETGMVIPDEVRRLAMDALAGAKQVIGSVSPADRADTNKVALVGMGQGSSAPRVG